MTYVWPIVKLDPEDGEQITSKGSPSMAYAFVGSHGTTAVGWPGSVVTIIELFTGHVQPFKKENKINIILKASVHFTVTLNVS